MQNPGAAGRDADRTGQVLLRFVQHHHSRHLRFTPRADRLGKVLGQPVSDGFTHEQQAFRGLFRDAFEHPLRVADDDDLEAARGEVVAKEVLMFGTALQAEDREPPARSAPWPGGACRDVDQVSRTWGPRWRGSKSRITGIRQIVPVCGREKQSAVSFQPGEPGEPGGVSLRTLPPGATGEGCDSPGLRRPTPGSTVHDGQHGRCRATARGTRRWPDHSGHFPSHNACTTAWGSATGL